MTTRDACTRLASELLDAHERSRSFGRPGPWPRDVIVKLDRATFPAAFADDGREELAALRAAAEALERAGAARLVRGAGWSDAEPREVRLGPEHVARTYAFAAEHGYVALDGVLEDVAAHAAALAADAPAWMAAFLRRVAERLRARSLEPLGMQVERFKRERGALVDALTAATRIAAGASGWERVLSERVFGDSKRLAAVRGLAADLLVRADPRWDAWHPGDAVEVLEVYGVRRKPGLLRCAGRARLEIAGRGYALEDFTPVAHLPEAWADAWVAGVVAAAPSVITTIENETPFLLYVDEADGPAGLGARGELAIYTGGFPAPALLDALAAICRGLPDVRVRHWGDADLGGLRIWWFLRERVAHQVTLHRVDRAWLDAELARRPGTPLSPTERAALDRFRRDLTRGPATRRTDVAQALALAEGLLQHGMKLEQER